jgi:4-carboxymuconolactone decarboxylase
VARLDPLEIDQLSPEQKLLHAELGRTRKRVSGPFAIWLRNPALADAANKLTLVLRENGKLDRRLFELIVMTVVRHWSAQYAWAAHVGAALAAGLSPDVIAALRERRKPGFAKDDERLVYEAVSELLDTKSLAAATYQKLLDRFGIDLTIEIITVAGFYGMVSTVLTGFDVPTPNGERPFNS